MEFVDLSHTTEQQQQQQQQQPQPLSPLPNPITDESALPTATALTTAPLPDPLALPGNHGFTVRSGTFEQEWNEADQVPNLSALDLQAIIRAATDAVNAAAASRAVQVVPDVAEVTAIARPAGSSVLRKRRRDEEEEEEEVEDEREEESTAGDGSESGEADEDYEPPNDNDNDEDDNDSGTVNCTKCDKKFGNRASLKRHLSRSHKPPPTPQQSLTCTNCGRPCMNAQNLKRHMNNAHSGSSHTCPLCPATFGTARSLSLHKSGMHGGVSPTQGGPSRKRRRGGNKVFECELCEYKSGQSFNVTRHFRNVHAGLVRLECRFEGCERICRSKANLNTHEMNCKRRPS